MIRSASKIILTLLLLLSFSQAYGQTNKGDDFDNIELSQEQWEAVRDTFAIYAIKHLARLDTLQLQIDSLKLVNAQWEARDCEAELYSLVGATKDEVADFRLKFNETESRINTKTSSPDDVRRMYLDEVKSSKIRCLPEFSERYAAMINTFSSFASNENTTSQNTLITTNTNNGTYLVVKGDYLWLVAQKNYNNPNLWPAIWEANKFGTANPGYFYYLSYDQVSNPNLIYPGQVLKIPVLTEEEKKVIEEKSHRYKKFKRILPQN